MISSSTSRSSRRRADRALGVFLWTSGIIAASVALLVLAFVASAALPTLTVLAPWRFVSGGAWHPIDGAVDMTALALGSLLVTFGAIALALPLGLLVGAGTAIYAPPRLGGPLRVLLGVLAGIPSVVYGLWGLTVLVPLINRWHAPGASLLAGALVLSLMVLPTIALAVEASLRSLPGDLWRGSAALGLTRWSTLTGVALPAIRSGIGAGILLSVTRALGETMAVLMVCGNVVETPRGVFDPIRTLTANIALEMSFALGDHRSALFVSGLLLMALVVALAVAAEVIGKERIYG